jgi:hypothetical protein
MKVTGISVLAISLVGSLAVIFSHAETPTIPVEPETLVASGNAYGQTDSTASNKAHIRFGPNIAFGGASPGGTYADWLYAGTGLESIEWTEVAIQNPAESLRAAGLLHYYAYTFNVTADSTNQSNISINQIVSI